MDIYMSQTGTVGKGNARKVGEVNGSGIFSNDNDFCNGDAYRIHNRIVCWIRI